jgi:hypothetical protein
VFTRVKKGGGFYGWLEAVVAFLARQGCWGRGMGRLDGQGTMRCGRRRATAVGQWRRMGGAVWLVCGTAWLGPRPVDVAHRD